VDRWNGDERVKQVVLAAEAFENYWKSFQPVTASFRIAS
jgi:hypothetical protein